VVARPSTLGRNLASLSAEGRPTTPYDYSRRIGLQIGNGADPAEQVTQLRDKFPKWHYVTTYHNCMQSTHVALLIISRAAIYAFLYSRSYDNDRSEESSASPKGDVRRRSNRLAIAETVDFLTAARDHKAPALWQCWNHNAAGDWSAHDRIRARARNLASRDG